MLQVHTPAFRFCMSYMFIIRYFFPLSLFFSQVLLSMMPTFPAVTVIPGPISSTKSLLRVYLWDVHLRRRHISLLVIAIRISNNSMVEESFENNWRIIVSTSTRTMIFDSSQHEPVFKQQPHMFWSNPSKLFRGCWAISNILRKLSAHERIHGK